MLETAFYSRMFHGSTYDSLFVISAAAQDVVWDGQKGMSEGRAVYALFGGKATRPEWPKIT